MATVAVFMVLGGGAYAATTLPANSVGQAQIRPDAVSRSKLTDGSVGSAELRRGSVTRSRLSRGVRKQIDAGASQGPRGATGPRGGTGLRGPAGTDGASAGARRINYDVAVSLTPVATTIAELPGLSLQAACFQNGADVNVGLRIRPTEDAVVQSNFTLDTGVTPANPPPPGDPAIQTGNGQPVIALEVRSTKRRGMRVTSRTTPKRVSTSAWRGFSPRKTPRDGSRGSRPGV
jgi:hypothetical protein